MQSIAEYDRSLPAKAPGLQAPPIYTVAVCLADFTISQSKESIQIYLRSSHTDWGDNPQGHITGTAALGELPMCWQAGSVGLSV